MQATLTELRRETGKVIRPVIHGGKAVILTEHGREVARIIPKRNIDRKGALALLKAMGPIELPFRK